MRRDRPATGRDDRRNRRAVRPVRDKMFGSKWVAMRGLRIRIAHGYHVVDLGLHWLTVTEELPAVRKALENRLSREEDG